MYQEFFRLQALPFGLTPNLSFYCQLKGHQEALEVLQFCIKSGEGFIKIIGEVGCGKTLLCRKVIDILDETYLTAYIPNPDLNPIEIRKAFARELGINPTEWQDQNELLTAIYQRLIEVRLEGKKTILLIDEAQVLTDDSLETIRLLTNLETESEKLLQVILFGQPELDKRLEQKNLRQLKQRISFSYAIPLMKLSDLDIYLSHRLAIAGYTHGNLFTKSAKKLLYKASGGIPRIVNVLSHKSLLVAYGMGERQINRDAVKMAIHDTESVQNKKGKYLLLLSVSTLTALSLLSIFILLEGVLYR